VCTSSCGWKTGKAKGQKEKRVQLVDTRQKMKDLKVMATADAVADEKTQNKAK